LSYSPTNEERVPPDPLRKRSNREAQEEDSRRAPVWASTFPSPGPT